ncbi:Uncharacterized membrane protein YuiD [Linum grandiflorum]
MLSDNMLLQQHWPSNSASVIPIRKAELSHLYSLPPPPNSVSQFEFCLSHACKSKPNHLGFHNSRSRRRSSSICFSSIQPADIVAGVAQNKVLIAAGVSAAIGQISKPFTSVLFYGRDVDFRSAFQAGGFPSTHSSAVVAAATCLAFERGFSDSIFGLSVVYAGLVMYDAQGVRREVGTHAKVVNRMLLHKKQQLPKSNDTADEFLLIQKQEEAQMFASSSSSSTSINKQPSTRAIISNKTAATSSPPIIRTPLKESIGHTEIEVVGGALLGFLGAHPPDSKTPTTYESVTGGENRTRTDIHSREDQGMIQIDKLQDKVKDDPVGAAGVTPVFGPGRDDDQNKHFDSGVTGTPATD